MGFRDGRRAAWIAGAAALLVAVAMRVHNAIHFALLWGFDAKFNWRYIRRLTMSWELPAPDADWSTAHPPLFYYLNAAIVRMVDGTSREFKIVLLRLLVSAAGVVIAALAVRLVRRAHPDDWPRAVLAGVLVLFLPMHIYMSAMVTEEMIVAMWMSLVLLGAASHLAAGRDGVPLRHATWMGIVGGLALLTKLTGLLVLGAVAAAYLAVALRRGTLRGTVAPVAWMLALGLVVGGWFYLRNWIGYGYLYPHGLETHKIMFTMPPGQSAWLDYLRLPLAIWTDPQAVNPDLVQSIWGSTFVSIWFDSHRVFLPRDTAAVTRAGTLILTLALIPTAAFACGLARGARRAWSNGRGVDVVLLALVAITLAGYVAFTWRNPWFVTRKGSFLMCLTLPYAYYTSGELMRWLRRPGWTRVLLIACLAALCGAIVATFTWSELFWSTRHMSKPGVLW